MAAKTRKICGDETSANAEHQTMDHLVHIRVIPCEKSKKNTTDFLGGFFT